MNHELKQIKNLYGEKFSHLCRDLFSTILDNDGILLEILIEEFEPNHFLYDDIINECLIESFKNYIYNIYHEMFELSNIDEKEKIKETPEELMEKAGYILKECTTEEEIQEYKKYYASGEELCTFKNERLNKCRVFFAVKKNALEIKREDFKTPRRQDEYGTSVISIQFTKDETNTLSIKNRYNHTVNNPDSTFSNNLDNIIAGLTESFENTYGIIQKYKNNDFEIPNYVRANDGKLYKYNYEIYNVYYCPNNVVIDNYEVKKFDKEKYIILDCFVLDLENKKISTYNHVTDSFIKDFKNIVKIQILKEESDKRIIVTPTLGENIEILINNHNQIIEYKNNNIEVTGDYYLVYNKTLTKFEALNLNIIYNSFMYSNESLKVINCPNVEFICNNFLENNKILEHLELPKLRKVGDSFLRYNTELSHFFAPKLENAGYSFLYGNLKLEVLELPNLKSFEFFSLMKNNNLKKFIAPSLKVIGSGFLENNNSLEIIECSKLDKFYFNYMNKHVYDVFFRSSNLVSKIIIKLNKI